MKNTFNKMISLLLTLLVVFSVSCTAFAAGASGVLSYSVASDGYAVVADCSEAARGVVEIPSKVTINGKEYKVRYIGEKAFDACHSVTGIIIPEGVTAIRSHAFRDCILLQDVYIPTSLIVCQYDAFDGCGTVTVHCYRANYQFFTVQGASANLVIDILDPLPDEEITVDKQENTDFISRFIEALKNLINSILDYFGANEGEENIIKPPFLDNLPFEI